jgi:hypothetical protein
MESEDTEDEEHSMCIIRPRTLPLGALDLRAIGKELFPAAVNAWRPHTAASSMIRNQSEPKQERDHFASAEISGSGLQKETKRESFEWFFGLRRFFWLHSDQRIREHPLSRIGPFITLNCMFDTGFTSDLQRSRLDILGADGVAHETAPFVPLISIESRPRSQPAKGWGLVNSDLGDIDHSACDIRNATSSVLVYRCILWSTTYVPGHLARV